MRRKTRAGLWKHSANPSRPSREWRESFVENLKTYVMKGDYKGGLKIAQAALKEHPDEFVCRFQYAKLLGDWADELPLKKQMKLKREAFKILRPLTRKMSGLSPEERFGVCLNYYYQAFKFPEMYRFGKRFVRADRRKGFYAQGIGSCLQAARLLEKGREASARTWAKKSVRAWKKYDLKSEKYYFPHYTLAKALAIQGEKKAAMTSLKKAASLSRRKISDWEFADVLKLL